MRYELSADRARQAVLQHTARLGEVAAAAGPDAPVPTADGWRTADVVEHLGQTQHWVAEILERRISDPSQLPSEMVPMPADPQSWAGWLDESAARVVAAASDEALTAEVFNAAGDERSGGQFWLQSMTNEAVVHGFDGAAAAAGDPAVAVAGFLIDADVAAELIANHLAMLTSPTWAVMCTDSAEALRGSGQVLRWRATDLDGATTTSWAVRRDPDGAVVLEGAAPDDPPADVTVSGPASSLVLLLARRLPLQAAAEGDLTVDGDADLVQHWLANTAHVAG